MPGILDLESRYQASSTVHLRTYNPFYNQTDIRKITKHPACSEIALHGEFVGHAKRFGSVFEAAVSEKRKLEEITSHEVLGVSLHGGELVVNNTVEAQAAIPKAGFLYNTTKGPSPYYFPYRYLKDDESFEVTYQINTNFGDIRIPYSKLYADDFYTEALRQVKAASEQGGILVMMLHPLYFDLDSYLSKFTNLVRLLLFLPIYLNRLIKATKVSHHKGNKA
jgi:hypothetical protein